MIDNKALLHGVGRGRENENGLCQKEKVRIWPPKDCNKLVNKSNEVMQREKY